jgi:hypothetical protein
MQCDGNGMDRSDIVNGVKDIFRTEESRRRKFILMHTNEDDGGEDGVCKA